MGELKALIGFRAARYWPITTNNSTTYATETMKAFVGARSLTKDEVRTEYEIPGDDGIYATGSRYRYQDMELEVDELPLELQAALKGGTYVEADQTYYFEKDDEGISFAFGYAAPLLSGNFRMWKHYACKVLSIKIDHTTQTTDKIDAQTYKIKFRNTYREADGRPEFEKDSADGTYDWLNSIDQLPAA